MTEVDVNMSNMVAYYFAEPTFERMKEMAGLTPGQSIEHLTNEAVLRLVGAFTIEHSANEATNTAAITAGVVVDSVNDGPHAAKGAALKAFEVIAESGRVEEKDIVIAVINRANWYHGVKRVIPPFKTALLIRYADIGGSERHDVTRKMNASHTLKMPGSWAQRMDPRKLGF